MTPHFLPTLVNRPFDDPGLYLDFLFERRAVLFDLGDLAPLGARKLLRVSDVCVSHTHIDHFIGFDRLLRIMLGREKTVRLFGPPGILRQVESRLASYSWNLIGSYPTVFTLTVSELSADGTGIRATFSSRRAFARESEQAIALGDNVLLDEENLRIRCAFLEHSIPCLAYAFEEKQHVNFKKNRLAALGAPVGPWLSEVKRAVLSGEPDDTEIVARGAKQGGRGSSASGS
jgi:ribonuclease Z